MRQCCIRTQASACTYEERSDLKLLLLYCASSGRRPWALARTFCVYIYIYSTSRRKEGRNQESAAVRRIKRRKSRSWTSGLLRVFHRHRPRSWSCSTESILRLTDAGGGEFRTRTRTRAVYVYAACRSPRSHSHSALGRSYQMLFCALR